MKKKQIIKVHFDIYNTDMFVYFGYDGKEVWQDLKSKFNIDQKAEPWIAGWKYDRKKADTNAARTVSLYDRGGGVLIMFGNDPRVGTVGHEALHAVSFMLKSLGIPFRASTEEAYAYAVGYFIDQIIAKRK